MTVLIQNPPAQPQKLATLHDKEKIHLTVLTVGRAVRFAKDRSTLDKPPIVGGTSGLIITDVTGTVEIEWEGELWALGDPANPTAPQVEVSI